MKELFRGIKSDKILFRSSIFSLVIILLSLLNLALYYKSLPPFIPLFNQMPWGEERITQTVLIFIIPFIAFAFLVINIIFANFIYKRIPLIARLFSITSFLISLLALLFVVRTIHVVL